MFLKHDLLNELQCFEFTSNVPNVKFIVNHGLALLVQLIQRFNLAVTTGAREEYHVSHVDLERLSL